MFEKSGSLWTMAEGSRNRGFLEAHARDVLISVVRAVRSDVRDTEDAVQRTCSERRWEVRY
jgi:hypothetical protein